MTVGASVVSTCMTNTISTSHPTVGDENSSVEAERLRRRFRPLYAGAALQGVLLWVPVEKLFMKGIGFDAARMGMVAACYAAGVPFLEIPSGILADRWSRRGVLIAANVALAASSMVGGLSNNVTTYLLAAFFLGVFFAVQSGTVDSIIYDTIVEETGHGDGFEKAIGRLRVWQSAALVASALAGGVLASITSPRLTYFVTIPFVLASVVVLRRFREPQLSASGDREPIRDQIAATYRTLLAHRPLRPVIAAMVITSVLLQAVFEFGPIWMLAVAAPAFLYGPQWAGLMSSSGIAGLIVGRVDLNRPTTVRGAVAVMVSCATTLVVSDNAVVLIGAQTGLAIVLVTVSIVLTRRLHDSIPSTIRAGVSSGIGTLTWIAFLPFAIVFGYVANRAGVHTAGWMILAATLAASTTIIQLTTASSGQSSAAVGDPTSTHGPSVTAHIA